MPFKGKKEVCEMQVVTILEVKEIHLFRKAVTVIRHKGKENFW